MARTWILTGSPENYEATKALGFAVIGLKERNRNRALEIEEALRAIQAEKGRSSKKAFMPVRAAITGSTVTPPLFESMALLGRARTLARLHAAATPG